jgi:hypothetical protein
LYIFELALFNVRVRVLNTGLLARNQSCDLPTRESLSMVFLGTRANAELLPEFHVALDASNSALQMVTSKLHPNIALLVLMPHDSCADSCTWTADNSCLFRLRVITGSFR